MIASILTHLASFSLGIIACSLLLYSGPLGPRILHWGGWIAFGICLVFLAINSSHDADEVDLGDDGCTTGGAP